MIDSASVPRPTTDSGVPIATDNAEPKDYLTVLSDAERLTGAHALGPEGGERLQQATLAIRAGVPLDFLRDTTVPEVAS